MVTQLSEIDSALQAHSFQLQAYLMEWTKQQQQLLSNISSSPRLEAGIGQEANAESMTTMDAANIISPDDARLIFEPSDNPAIEETFGEPLQTDDGGSGVVERFRDELVGQFQASLNMLQKKMRPQKDDLEGWVVQTLSALEEEVGKLELLDIYEEPKALSASDIPSQKSSVLVERHKMLRHQTRYEMIHSQFDCLLHSRRFELIIATVIFCNSVVMGISADHSIKHPGDSESSILDSLEMGFLSFYASELLLRILLEGRRFFTGEDYKWNWFDFLLVVLAVFDLIDFAFSGANVSFLRLLKLLKMAKLLRMIRLMKAFKQLRLLLASIIGSLNAMCWAFLLVGIICYTASILFLNLITNFLLDTRSQNKDLSVRFEMDIDKYWSSVATSINSLVGAATGGDDWFMIARPLKDIGWFSYVLFLFYMGFFLIVLLNAFTSLFVQAVLEHEARDAASIIKTEMENKDKYIKQLQCIFDRMDDDGDGFLSLAEFLKHAGDPELYTWASYLGIDLTDAQHFFEILSNHGTQVMDIEAFVVGCIKLKGAAREVDLMAIYELSKQTHRFVSQCFLALEVQKHEVAKLHQKSKDIVAMIYAGNSLSTLYHKCGAERKGPPLSL